MGSIFDYINPFAGAQSGLDYIGGKGGYNIAANGAQAAGDRSAEFSGTQWDRQMEGLGKAQGAYQPAMDYWNSQYGAQGSGAGENWYSQNGGAFNNPQRTSTTFDASRTWAMDPNQNATQGGAWQATNFMGQANGADNAYHTMGAGLAQPYYGPQNGGQQWAQSQPQFNQSGAAENFYAKNQPRYNTQTNANAYYNQAAQQLTGPSRSASWTASDPDAQAVVDHDNNQRWAQAPNSLAQNEAENKGMIRGASQAHDYLNSQMGALQGPGQYEQFVTADINGANPLYDRTKKQGIATINQEMARRGGFNSGSAVDRIGNYTGALDAADYENRANRAKDAQGMQLARIGQGSQSAQGAAGLDIQRGTSLGGLDAQNESAAIARRNYGLANNQQFFDQNMATNRLSLDAARQADDSTLARLMGGGQLSAQADNSDLNQLNAGQRASSDAQSQMLARLMGGMNSSNQLDQTRLASDQQGLARQMGSFNMAQGSDALNMAKAQQAYNMGQGVDQSNMARYNMLGQQGQNADQFDLQRLLGQGGMAFNAQNADQARKAQAMAALFGIDNAQAGQYGNFYGAGGQLSGQAMTDAINAWANSAQLRGQAENAGGQALLKGAGLYAQTQTPGRG